METAIVARTRLDMIVRLYMAATGEAQSDVATQLGVTPSMLSYLMDGKRGPSQALRDRIVLWLLGAHSAGEKP